MAERIQRPARKLGLGWLWTIALRIVLVACLLVSANTILGAWRNLSFAFSGVTTEGRVVRQIEELAADWDAATVGKAIGGLQMTSARRLFRAIVEFRDGAKTYSIAALARGPVHVYPVGSRVDVVYERGRPGDGKLKPELPDFWTQAGYLLMATMLGSSAVYWWWKLIRRRGRINPLPDGRTSVSGG